MIPLSIHTMNFNSSVLTPAKTGSAYIKINFPSDI